MSSAEIARRTTRGSLVIFGGNLVSTVILAVSAIIIARLLGPGSYGSYSLVVIVVQVLQLFVGFGVSSAITRHSAFYLARGEKATARRFSVNAMIFLTIFGMALSAICFVGASFFASFILHRPALTSFVRFFSIIVLAQTVFQSAIYGLTGWNAMGLASVATVLQSTIRLSIAPILVFVGYGVAGALAGYGVGYVVGAGVALGGFYFYKLRGLGGELNSISTFVGDVKEMISFGAPLYVGAVLTGLSTYYVAVLVAQIASDTVVGYYQAASNVTAAITLSSGAIAVGLFPAFSSLHGLGEDTASAFRHATKYVVYLMAPIIFFLVGASGLIMRILYGAAFSSAGTYLILLAVAALPLIIGVLVANIFFSAIGKTRLPLVVNVTGAIALFILAPVLGKVLNFGVVGLIGATIVSGAISMFLGLYFASRYLQASADLRAIGAIIGASLLGWGAMLPVSLLGLTHVVTLLVDLVIFLAVYLTTAPLLRTFDEADIARLRAAISGMGVFGKILEPILGYELLILARVHGSKPASPPIA
jgi:stage V sporulation protein B